MECRHCGHKNTLRGLCSVCADDPDVLAEEGLAPTVHHCPDCGYLVGKPGLCDLCFLESQGIGEKPERYNPNGGE